MLGILAKSLVENVGCIHFLKGGKTLTIIPIYADRDKLVPFKGLSLKTQLEGILGSIRHHCTAEVGVIEVSTADVSAAEISFAKVGIAQIGIG